MTKNTMMRVNTRISRVANEWLDNYSKHTGIPKSTLIFLAIENFIQQKEAQNNIKELNDLINTKLQEFEQKINKVEK